MPRSGLGRGARTARQEPQPEHVAAPRAGHKTTGAFATLHSHTAPNAGGAALAALQNTAGNGAVAHLLRSQRKATPRSRQAKLVVGSANDPLEREADFLAQLVMRTWSSGSARVRPEDLGEAALQRLAEPGHDRASAFEADDSVAQRLAARSGGGHALPAPVRNRMEAGFGADFSKVRIHRDAEAANLSTGLAASAFTHGANIYFGPGAYEPGSCSGQHLLAHELAHVVQKGGAPVQRWRNESGAAGLLQGRFTPIQRMKFRTHEQQTSEPNSTRSGKVAGSHDHPQGPAVSPRSLDPAALSASGYLQMQRMVSNRATVDFLKRSRGGSRRLQRMQLPGDSPATRAGASPLNQGVVPHPNTNLARLTEEEIAQLNGGTIQQVVIRQPKSAVNEEGQLAQPHLKHWVILFRVVMGEAQGWLQAEVTSTGYHVNWVKARGKEDDTMDYLVGAIPNGCTFNADHIIEAVKLFAVAFTEYYNPPGNYMTEHDDRYSCQTFAKFLAGNLGITFNEDLSPVVRQAKKVTSKTSTQPL